MYQKSLVIQDEWWIMRRCWESWLCSYYSINCNCLQTKI